MSELFIYEERPLRRLIFSKYANSEWFASHESDIRFELNHLELHDLDNYLFNLHNKNVKVESNPNDSNIAFLIGITDQEPNGRIKTDGGSFPDIDIDFDLNRRGEVIQHLIDRYGADYVAGIGTFSYMKAKSLFKDLCRLISVPLDKVKLISKLMPDDLADDSESIKCISEVFEEEPELKKIMDSDPQIAHVVECGKHFTGIVRSAGRHACGHVISPVPVSQIVPLAVLKRTKDDDGGDIPDIPATQFDGKTIEKFGILKYDILGLKNLSVIDNCVRMVRENHDVSIDLDNLNLEDPKPYDLIAKGNSLGIFQIEGSAGLRSFAARAKPSTISELSDIIALYRPGPMGMKAHEMYIQAKNGEISSTFEIPDYHYIFKDSYGLIVYQEQVMQLATDMSGFTDIRADVLRKAVGKKDRALLLSLKNEFVEGAAAKGIDRNKVDKLFDSMEEFARYGFNKSHSVAYAMIAYQTAYLKAHYMPEFMASLISFAGDIEAQAEYIEDAKRNQIDILPPDINESGTDFKVSSSGQILFGLGCIKGLGEKVVDSIFKIRPFGSFAEFLIKAYHAKGINKKSIEVLICAGAMDSFGFNRSSMLANFETFLTQYSNSITDENRDQVDRAFIAKQAEYFVTPHISEFSLFTIAKHEKELLGITISGDPFRIIDEIVKQECKTFDQFRDLKFGSYYAVVNLVKVKKIVTKSAKKEMAFLDMKDRHNAMLSAVVFPDRYESFKTELNEGSFAIVHIANNVKDGAISYIVNSVKDLSKELDSAASQTEADKSMRSINVHLDKNPGTSSINSVMKVIAKYAKEEITGSTISLILHFGNYGFKIGEFNVSNIDISLLRTFGSFPNVYVTRGA